MKTSRLSSLRGPSLQQHDEAPVDCERTMIDVQWKLSVVIKALDDICNEMPRSMDIPIQCSRSIKHSSVLEGMVLILGGCIDQLDAQVKRESDPFLEVQNSDKEVAHIEG